MSNEIVARNFALERSRVRPYLQWPINIVQGLHAFSLFRANVEVISYFFLGLASFLPGGLGTTPIECNLRLTRSRSFYDKII